MRRAASLCHPAGWFLKISIQLMAEYQLVYGMAPDTAEGGMSFALNEAAQPATLSMLKSRELLMTDQERRSQSRLTARLS